MPSTKEIIFKLGEETFPTILDSENIKNSPFEDVFKEAENRLQNIASQLLHINDNSHKNSADDDKDKNWEDITPNNIIAFLGERGSGKTSCMRTVVKNIKQNHKNWMYLNEIDPSFFDETHNILEILIGSLYGIFRKEIKEWPRMTIKTQTDLGYIQELFKNLKSTLQFLKNLPDFKDEYEIDALNHLNSGGKIRVLIKSLIDEILRYEDKQLLVVMIDDLDLNIQQSYIMMEHIRKYLLLPNVIILVAAKYEQLFDSVCRNLSEIFKNISYRVSTKDIADITERYINKLLPLDQRFEMPTVDSYINYRLTIIDEKGVSHTKESILLGVPSLIFEKTRYLFYNSSGIPSLVIPRNLRDLRMLTSMLFRMDSFHIAGNKNKRLFKDYFFKEWLGKIDPAYREFSQSLIDEENLAKINRFVIHNLYQFFLSQNENYKELVADLEITEKDNRLKDSSITHQRQLLRNILNPKNSYWNVSIGDVVTIINAVRKSQDSPKVTELLFLIESYYSIKLYETYDRMTGYTDKHGLNMPKDNTETAPELKTSVRGDVPEYFRLSGGAFFSTTGDYFLPYPRKSNIYNSRELCLINGKILLDEIRKIEKEYEELFEKTAKSKKTIIPANLTFRLRLCEFFILTIRDRIDLKSSDSNIRLQNEPLYFKKFGVSTKNMMFDITMPFFNAIYPQWTYGRFGQKIFEYAKKDPKSVLCQMINHKCREKDNDTWELMSKASIRNMEILEDLTEWLHDRRSELSYSNTIEVQKQFFSQFDLKEIKDPIPVGKYGVKTYGKTENGVNKPYYYIDYSIFAELEKVLASLIYSGDDKEIKEQTKTGEYFYYDVFNSSAIFPQKKYYTITEILETLRPYCSPLILSGYFPENSNSPISDYTLAERLAELRIKHGYDFDGKLPVGLQFYYSNFVKSESEAYKNQLTVDKEAIEHEINKIKNQLTQFDDEIRNLNKNVKQNAMDSKKIQKESVKNESKITELQSNLEYLQMRISQEEDKTELKRLRKEEEKAVKALNTAKATLEVAMKNISLLQVDTNSLLNSLPEYENKVKGLRTDLKKKQKEFTEKEKDLELLTSIMANPVSLD